MTVLLIDGRGRQRTMDVAEGLVEVRIPLPQPFTFVTGDSPTLPAYPVARFRHGGEYMVRSTGIGLAILPIYRRVP